MFPFITAAKTNIAGACETAFSIILASALHQASQGEPQKMRLPYKLQKILTFPEQTQGDDKPYQFSSVQFSCSIPRGFPQKTWAKPLTSLSWEL